MIFDREFAKKFDAYIFSAKKYAENGRRPLNTKYDLPEQIKSEDYENTRTTKINTYKERKRQDANTFDKIIEKFRKIENTIGTRISGTIEDLGKLLTTKSENLTRLLNTIPKHYNASYTLKKNEFLVDEILDSVQKTKINNI